MLFARQNQFGIFSLEFWILKFLPWLDPWSGPWFDPWCGPRSGPWSGFCRDPGFVVIRSVIRSVILVLSTPAGSGLFTLAVVLGQIFRQIVSLRVMTLINTNVVALREEVLLPVAVCHSKVWQRKRHAFRARRNGFFGGNFLFRISE